MRYYFLLLGLVLSACNLQNDFSLKDNRFSSGKTYKINLQPFGQVDKILIKDLVKELNDSVNASINLIPAVPFPKNAYYSPRKRYIADSMIKYLQNKSVNGAYYIGLTNRDISTFKEVTINWGVMGLGYQPGNACMVSSFRIKGKNGKLQERFYKVVVHELGHNFGLSHCENAGCYMMDAEGKMKMDEEHFFCKKCWYFLEQKSFFK